MASPTALPGAVPVFSKEEVPAGPSTPSSTGMFAPVTNLYGRLQAWRRSLDMPNPGTVENIQKEVKCMHLPLL